MNRFMLTPVQHKLCIALLVVSIFFAPFAGNTLHAQDTSCGPMDVTFLIDNTGSMSGALNNVKSEAQSLVDDIVAASGGDYQMALATFMDNVSVLQAMAPTNADAVTTSIGNIPLGNGNAIPEASDVALKTAVDFQNWRGESIKIIILITDAPPAGTDDAYDKAADYDNGGKVHAESAAAKGIRI